MMKRIRMLGLAVVAALAAMAFVGASSASATTLCDVSVEGECPAASRVALPTTITSTAAPVWLLKPFTPSEFGCQSSGMTLKVEKSLGAGKGLSGQVTNMSFSGCQLTSCSTVEVLNLPYHAEIHESSKNNGTLTLSDSGKGKPTLHLAGCPQGATCNYSAESLELGFEGAVPSVLITALEEPLTKGTCGTPTPEKVYLTANYVVGGQTFAASTAKSELVDSSNNVLSTCESEMAGSLSGSVSTLNLSSCTSPYSCNQGKALNLPYSTVYVPSAPGEGTVEISNVAFELLNCAFGAKCTFSASGALSLEVKNNYELIASKEPLSQSGCLFFPASNFWNATYTMTGPRLAVTASP